MENIQIMEVKPEEMDALNRELQKRYVERKNIKKNCNYADKSALIIPKEENGYADIMAYIDLILNNCYKGKKLGDLIAQLRDKYGIELTTKFLSNRVTGRKQKTARVLFVLAQENLKTRQVQRFYKPHNREVLKKIISWEEFNSIENREKQQTENFKQELANRELKPQEISLTDRQEKAIKKLQNKGNPFIKVNCKRCKKEVKFHYGKDIENNQYENMELWLLSMYVKEMLAGTKVCSKCSIEIQKQNKIEMENLKNLEN